MDVKFWIDWNADGTFADDEEMSTAAIGQLRAERGSSFRVSARRGGDAGRLSARLRALPQFASTSSFRNAVKVGNVRLAVRLDINGEPMWQGHLTSLTLHKMRRRTEYEVHATGALGYLAREYPNRAATQLVADGTLLSMIQAINAVEDAPVSVVGSDKEFSVHTFGPAPAQWFITNESYLSQLRDIEDGMFATLYESRDNPQQLYLRSPRSRTNTRTPQFILRNGRIQREDMQHDLGTVANVIQPHYRHYQPEAARLTWRVTGGTAPTTYDGGRFLPSSDRGNWRAEFSGTGGVSFSVQTQAANAGAFARGSDVRVSTSRSTGSWRGASVSNVRTVWTSTWTGRVSYDFVIWTDVNISGVNLRVDEPTEAQVRAVIPAIFPPRITVNGSVDYFTDPVNVVAPQAIDVTSRRRYGPRDYPLAAFWSSAEEVATYAAKRLALTAEPYYIGTVKFRPTAAEVSTIDIGRPGNVEIEEGVLPVYVEAIRYEIRAGGVVDMTLKVTAQEPWNGKGILAEEFFYL